MAIRFILLNKKYIYISLLTFLFVIGLSTKSIKAVTYNSSLFPVGYQGSSKEKVVFYSRTLKYEDNYYLEGATLEVTDDSHEDYVIVTFRHYVGHSGDDSHSNYMVVPCAFYIDDKKVAEWFISGYDNAKESEYKTGYRFRNTYRCIYAKEGIKVKRGKTVRLSAYDVGTSNETVSPLIWSKDYIYEYPLYSLDISTVLNGEQVQFDVGTFDVYIDNQLKGNDISSFQNFVYYKQNFEIKDIQNQKGYRYDSFLEGNNKGTVTMDTKCILDFRRNEYSFCIDFDHNLYGKTYKEGARVMLFDIYKNGVLLQKDADDFYTSSSFYNDVYVIKNIRYKNRCGYNGIDSNSLTYKYYQGEINIVHDIEDDMKLSINTLCFDESKQPAYIRYISLDTLSTLYKESLWRNNHSYINALNETLNNSIPKYSFYLSNEEINILKNKKLIPSVLSNQTIWEFVYESNN